MDYLKQADTGECKVTIIDIHSSMELQFFVQGYITYRREGSSALMIYEEFHPFLFEQFRSKLFLELPTFDRVNSSFAFFLFHGRTEWFI